MNPEAVILLLTINMPYAEVTIINRKHLARFESFMSQVW